MCTAPLAGAVVRITTGDGLIKVVLALIWEEVYGLVYFHYHMLVASYFAAL